MPQNKNKLYLVKQTRRVKVYVLGSSEEVGTGKWQSSVVESITERNQTLRVKNSSRQWKTLSHTKDFRQCRVVSPVLPGVTYDQGAVKRLRVIRVTENQIFFFLGSVCMYGLTVIDWAPLGKRFTSLKEEDINFVKPPTYINTRLNHFTLSS